MHFGPDYLEQVTLRDGSPAVLRCVRPEDKPMFVEGFKRMSSQTRFRRFFTPKSSLSDSELRYLTEIDGVDHFALGAARPGPDGLPAGPDAGLGVARFVRLKGRPKVAEPAVAIIDEAQGRGLGRIMFERLAMAARERGIERFQTEVLIDNEPMQHVLHEIAPSADFVQEGDVAIVEFEIPPIAPPAAEGGRPRLVDAFTGPLYRLLRTAARDGLVVAQRALAQIAELFEEDDE